MSCFVEQGLVVQKGIKTWAKSKSKLPVSYQMLVFTLLNEALNTKKKTYGESSGNFFGSKSFFYSFVKFFREQSTITMSFCASKL